MKKILLLIISLSLLIITYNVQAQEEEEESKFPIDISGSVDTYFKTNLTSKNVDADGDFITPGSSFANKSGFALGMVNLIASKEWDNVGFVADLVFGPRGSDAVFNSVASASIVNQLYGYWNVSDKVTLTLGNFNTFLGYEVISPVDNFNYSTSYMFSYGPFSHTGIKADISLSDNMSLMLGVLNPTDFTEFNPTSTYSIGAQLGYENDNGSIYFNVLYGDQDGTLDEDLGPVTDDTSAGNTLQFDITTGWNVTDAVYVGLNATYNTTDPGEIYNGTSIEDVSGDNAGFYGVAGYLQITTSDVFAIGTRIEYFSEFEEGAGAIGAYDLNGDANILDVTLTGQISVGDHLTLIPELRLDAASEDGTFPDSDLEATKSLASFLFGAVFSF
ncbi:porin [Fulvivirgaceae bacterium BMA12]|uniref:Porin n=1 Tax=Agaribacillus aureus TaxID=3051825 RepID=A0ABT8L366_9BACT|nr:porin [Fulvivirgaceae bacterium BMA12]